ncbi:DUF4870 domain-containing protein [Rubritalea spongiae]|uniref:DUF4870 domain-containing protein n=1 Tax=Rubritalea spongiae TaxID=430797 RepID=A0ABW5E4P5_9BACT
MDTETNQIPQPEVPQTLTTEQKNWAMFAHLSTFLGWIGIPLANIIAPLIIWQVKKDTMPFTSDQAKEALNFQITLSIAALICAALTLIFIGIIGLVALYIIQILFTIIAAIKANDGVAYRYPMTIRLIK